jgi:hypothetical protein
MFSQTILELRPPLRTPARAPTTRPDQLCIAVSAEQDKEKRSRCLFVALMISVSSVIAG